MPGKVAGTILAFLESAMINLTRRQALYLGLVPLSISLMPRTLAGALGVGDDAARERAALDCFRDLFADLGPPRAIGHRYLQSSSQERDRAFLQSAITRDKQLHNARQLRTLLAQKREHDFRHGDIAIVDGWVLSRTEVRTCALVALL
jgi:hypothetical protein